MTLFIFSCNTFEKRNKDTHVGTKVDRDGETYALDTSGISLQWTAYKFTDKVGVNGTFDEYWLYTNEKAGCIENLLKGDKIIINTLSVNSGSRIRDSKLKTCFFKAFGTDTISGEILEARDGKGIMALEINAIRNTIDYTYSLKKDTLFLSTAISLSNWEGEEAVYSLDPECYDLHMGADSISRLWPNVDIAVKLPLKIDSTSSLKPVNRP